MDEQQVIRIGALVNKDVWHYGSKRNKNGTYTLTGLDFKKQLKVGDMLDAFTPSALFRVLTEPVRTDSTATFEGVYAGTSGKGIHFAVDCEFLQSIDRSKKAEAARP